MHAFDLQWFFPIAKGALFGLLAMALHEAGHICASLVVGVRVKRVGMGWKGMYTVREAGPPEKNATISLAGPLTNLALMAFWPWLPIFGLANFCCGACNLVPIPGSDGKRILKCLREMRDVRPPAYDPKLVAEIKQRPFGAVKLDARKESADPAA